MTKYTIDATHKKIGRVASEAAALLMGKNRTDFVRNKAFDVEVKINNASKVNVTAREKEEKVYKNFSGYPGGLNTATLKRLVEKKGMSEAIKLAVYGMIPGNKLRKQRMKNLIISE